MTEHSAGVDVGGKIHLRVDSQTQKSASDEDGPVLVSGERSQERETQMGRKIH